MGETAPTVLAKAIAKSHAVGHSPAYTGAGVYKSGTTNPGLKAVGHSLAYHGPGTYETFATPVNPAASGGVSPAAGGYGRTVAPASAGTASAGTAATAAAAAPPDPRDSTYYGDVYGEGAKVGNQINGINQKEGFANTTLQQALGNLQQQKPLAELKQQQAANAHGLFYSGALGQQLGQTEQSYADKAAGLNSNFGNLQSSDASQIAALQQGLGVYTQGQYAAAVARAAAAAAANKAAAQPTTTTKYGAAVGHSMAYQGAGTYKTAGPQSPLVKAIGHSLAYRGPGTYVAVK